MTIVFEPGNPHDFSQGELRVLADLLRERLGDIEVEYRIRSERGYGVTLNEVLHVFLAMPEGVRDTIVTLTLTAIISWARDRWLKDRKEHPNASPRPRIVILYDGEGEPLKSIRIDKPEGEPTEENAKETLKRPRRSPGSK